MRSLLRLMLLCLMAVALPLQGFAATGALHCAAMHERMQVQAAHHHDDGAAHSHDGHGGHHAANATPPSGDGGHDDGPARVGGTFKCSACAACCVGLGLPASAITLPPGPAERVAPRLVADAVAAFLTSGPERPPRARLA
jgi:hypothetical protein